MFKTNQNCVFAHIVDFHCNEIMFVTKQTHGETIISKILEVN